MSVVVDPTGEPDEGGYPTEWVREMDGRGARHFGEPLRPPADTTGVRRRNGEVIVSDGPFAESKEWIAGFDLIEAADLVEAVEIAAKHPMARSGLIELRPLWPFALDDDHFARFEREAAERGRRSEPSSDEVLAALASLTEAAG
ncbi:hypothetical protein ET445_01415 [Agromyces protaetiae]|uniref:YCII-related domain-containing protein n=2 Tax=Agromyces protaetiae TaxID=2509455 RepID=A0A4P6FVZ9_9MICO|nr:hypothetical protein ET445_01415 [Agromyces protaetiae]